jgi:hypothetical protein
MSLDWSCASGSLPSLQSLLLGQGSYQKAQSGKALHPTSHGCCIAQFLKGFWTEGLGSWLLWSAPLVVSIVGSPTLQFAWSKAARGSLLERHTIVSLLYSIGKKVTRPTYSKGQVIAQEY